MKMKEGFQNIRIQPERDPAKEVKNKKKGLTRRDFLLGGLALGGATLLANLPDSKEEEVTLSKEVEEIAKAYTQEDKGEVLTPLEQLQIYGEVRDLEKGLKVYHDQHYEKLTVTEEGMKDMYDAVSNMSKFDLQKMIKPFEEKGLSTKLAYMVAIQETRARNKKSSVGALGVTGIMPATAKAHGYTQEDLKDPYIASEITAEYFANERDVRFGNNEDMLLHAYNAGGGLFGFTKTVSKEERIPKKFYEYMENYMNGIFSEVKERGYTHTLEKRDKTLSHVSKRFEVPLADILEANGLTENSPIHVGGTIIIPFRDMKHAAEVVFRKPLEALQYTPEIRAKYDALKDSGLIRIINVR
jgi:hypothetical protein